MKTFGIIVVCFFLFGWILIAGLIVLINSLKEINKSNNYGYPYYGFNNPFMDGFE